MTNSEATTNFMYFAYNFTPNQLQGMFAATSAPDHLTDKFNDLCRRKNLNGTQGIFAWFMELSQNNKDAVCTYINENYSWK